METTVCPYHFTHAPAAMAKFLQVVGLVPVRTSGLEYTLLRGYAGYVAVHGTDQAAIGSGNETHLCLATPSVDEYIKHHEDTDLELIRWDESWGVCAAAIDPNGSGVWINEVDHDLYGYQDVEENNEPTAEVVMVRYSKDFDADREFFALLGFQPAPGACPEWEQLSASEQSGWIGLHYPDQGQPSYRQEPRFHAVGKVPLVHLSFQTREELQQVAQRLTENGYPAQIVTDAVATKIHVTDPDGNRVEIHPSLKVA
ncbi:MAG: hypothetical protein Q4P06_05050 [Actinomycetaceae bacterium]|nr:hypothetical protein [Actinomycetaceae bacterium]